MTRTEFNQYLSHDARMDGVHVREDPNLLANVNALMWMVFGLGACLTLVGVRMLARPDVAFRPSPPLGSIRDVFENPD